MNEQKKTHVVFNYKKDSGEFSHFNIIKGKTDKEIEAALEKAKNEMIFRYVWIKDEDVIKAFISKPKISRIEDIKEDILEQIRELKSAVFSLENRVDELGDCEQ